MKKMTYIITPTWNNADYSIRCFDSIQKYTEDYTIIWIDNGSEDQQTKDVQVFLDDNSVPYVPILNEENLGFVKGTNQGLKYALEQKDCAYIVFQNNDTEVTKGWLTRLISVADSDPDIGLVGPITSPCDSWQSVTHLKGKLGIFDNLPDYDGDNDAYAAKVSTLYAGQTKEIGSMLAFFSTLLKRECVEQVGLLSEDYGVGFGDDDDYAERSKKAGWKLVLACDVFIFHNHRTTFKLRFGEENIQEMISTNMNIFYKKHKKYPQKFLGINLAAGADLIRKGTLSLKEQGLKEFCKNIYKLARHGRSYFK